MFKVGGEWSVVLLECDGAGASTRGLKSALTEAAHFGDATAAAAATTAAAAVATSSDARNSSSSSSGSSSSASAAPAAGTQAGLLQLLCKLIPTTRPGNEAEYHSYDRAENAVFEACGLRYEAYSLRRWEECL